MLALDFFNRNSQRRAFSEKIFMILIFFLLVGCSQNPELDSVGTPPPVSLEVGDE